MPAYFRHGYGLVLPFFLGAIEPPLKRFELFGVGIEAELVFLHNLFFQPRHQLIHDSLPDLFGVAEVLERLRWVVEEIRIVQDGLRDVVIDIDFCFDRVVLGGILSLSLLSAVCGRAFLHSAHECLLNQ
jgi:hypothetical protein